MSIVKYAKNILILLIIFVLAACGGPGEEVYVSGSGEPAGTVLNGQVADGYLVGARVFLDRNGNRILDSGEPWAETGQAGRYSLDVASGEGELYPVVAEIIAGRTIDEDQPGQHVGDSYQLEAPAGRWKFISPLTTLIKTEMDKNPAISETEAEKNVRSRIGLAGDISLFEDYVGRSEFGYAHRAARIIAGLMGVLQAEIELNAGSLDDGKRKAATALMISDQIMENCGRIAMALDEADSPAAIEEILTGLLAGIDTFRLNAVLLQRYIERMQEDHTVWDMAAPKAVRQLPPAGGSASIDSVVTLTLDEDIAQETLQDSSFQVFGPAGPVAGSLSYDPVSRQLEFVPDALLTAFSTYQVDISGIADLHGNPYEASQDWEFSTIFDQLPPELPEF
ncbi:MAG: Ig-like domain-containing protein [Desulfuromonadales bacterium]|nr:Ig-like domain-containing protein [Desulfuromonadales bacterium]